MIRTHPATQDRAGRASHGALPGLRHSATIACAGCGKFIAYADIESGASRCEFEPLNEFGPERIEHICPRCVAAESNPKQEGAGPVQQTPAANQ